MPKPVTPVLAADALIELTDRPGSPIILIERRNPPHGWAIPGGFVDVGESLPDAAVREAKEEVSLDIEPVCLLGCYSDPARDPRGHTVTAVYIARATGDPVAADDAAQVAVFDPERIDVELAFDHGRVLSHYLEWRRTGVVPAIT